MVWMRVLGVCLDERRCIDCSRKGMKNMGFWYSGRVGDCMAACIRLYFCSLFFSCRKCFAVSLRSRPSNLALQSATQIQISSCFAFLSVYHYCMSIAHFTHQFHSIINNFTRFMASCNIVMKYPIFDMAHRNSTLKYVASCRSLANRISRLRPLECLTRLGINKW